MTYTNAQRSYIKCTRKSSSSDLEKLTENASNNIISRRFWKRREL